MGLKRVTQSKKKAISVGPVPACQRQAKQTRTAEPRGTHRTDRQSLPPAFRPSQLTSGHFQCHVWIIHIPCSLLLSSTSNQNTNCRLQICTTPKSCLPRLRDTAICLMALTTQVLSVWKEFFGSRSKSVFLEKCNSSMSMTNI